MRRGQVKSPLDPLGYMCNTCNCPYVLQELVLISRNYHAAFRRVALSWDFQAVLNFVDR